MLSDEDAAAVKTYMGTLPTDVRLDSASGNAPDVYVTLSFSEKDFGFGEITIRQTEHGVFVDTESMGLARVRKFIHALLDRAVTDIDNDPERHALYNREMRRLCVSGCKVCNP